MCSSANGRLTRKSSPFSPLSSKPNKQSLLHRDMMVHYEKINKAKAVIDNKPPASMKNHIIAKDRKRKQAKAKQSQQPLRTSSRGSNMDALNETWAAVQSGRWSQLAHSLPSQSGFDTSGYSLNDAMLHLGINDKSNNNYLSETYDEFTPNSTMLENSFMETTLEDSSRVDVSGFSSRSKSGEDDQIRKERYIYSYKEEPRIDENRKKSFGYDSIHDPKFKKIKAQEEKRKEEEKYLKFVEDMTNDIIARNISSDRVLNKVFEYHVEKNRRNLDEDRMRILIDELKTDLSVKDHFESDED